jgi:O-antigen/teichoic acid export membrane protein
MARRLPSGDAPWGASTVLRTFEILFVGIGLVVGVAIVGAASLVGEHWLRSSVMPQAEIETAVRLMGLLFFLRWAQAPYVATLQGLQQQVKLSIANAGMYTIVNACAILTLVATPSIVIFFAALAAGTLVQLFTIRWIAWRADPTLREASRFDATAIRAGWRFSAGMLGISITATILMQMDKLLLTKLVPLEEYGLYAMAQVLAAGMSVVIMPIFNAVYPRLCELVAAGDETRLRASFLSASNLMSAVLVPTSVFLALFSYEVMALWTRSAVVAMRTAPLLTLLVIGTALNGLMFVPYALQLARGNTRIGVTINLVLCVVMVPSIIFLAYHFGIVGGASVWPALNALYLIAGLPLTWSLCLGSRDWILFYRDMLVGQAPSVCLIVVARAWMPLSQDLLGMIMELFVVLGLALAISLMLTPGVRGKLGVWAWRSS